MLILVLYVRDLFITGDDEMIDKCKNDLTFEFEMKDLGLMHYFLGLEIGQQSDQIIISQSKYALEILKRFGMLDCKLNVTPM